MTRGKNFTITTLINCSRHALVYELIASLHKSNCGQTKEMIPVGTNALQQNPVYRSPMPVMHLNILNFRPLDGCYYDEVAKRKNVQP